MFDPPCLQPSPRDVGPARRPRVCDRVPGGLQGAGHQGGAGEAPLQGHRRHRHEGEGGHARILQGNRPGRKSKANN